MEYHDDQLGPDLAEEKARYQKWHAANFRKYFVWLTPCRGDGKTEEFEVMARSPVNAVAVACIKKTGRDDASFFRDVSLATGYYGQVCVPAPTGGMNCVTGRVRVELFDADENEITA